MDVHTCAHLHENFVFASLKKLPEKENAGVKVSLGFSPASHACAASQSQQYSQFQQFLDGVVGGWYRFSNQFRLSPGHPGIYVYIHNPVR